MIQIMFKAFIVTIIIYMIEREKAKELTLRCIGYFCATSVGYLVIELIHLQQRSEHICIREIAIDVSIGGFMMLIFHKSLISNMANFIIVKMILFPILVGYYLTPFSSHSINLFVYTLNEIMLAIVFMFITTLYVIMLIKVLKFRELLDEEIGMHQMFVGVGFNILFVISLYQFLLNTYGLPKFGNVTFSVLSITMILLDYIVLINLTAKIRQERLMRHFESYQKIIYSFYEIISTKTDEYNEALKVIGESAETEIEVTERCIERLRKDALLNLTFTNDNRFNVVVLMAYMKLQSLGIIFKCDALVILESFPIHAINLIYILDETITIIYAKLQAYDQQELLERKPSCIQLVVGKDVYGNGTIRIYTIWDKNREYEMDAEELEPPLHIKSILKMHNVRYSVEVRDNMIVWHMSFV